MLYPCNRLPSGVSIRRLLFHGEKKQYLIDENISKAEGALAGEEGALAGAEGALAGAGGRLPKRARRRTCENFPLRMNQRSLAMSCT